MSMQLLAKRKRRGYDARMIDSAAWPIIWADAELEGA
jgi:hypothetical protein